MIVVLPGGWSDGGVGRVARARLGGTSGNHVAVIVEELAVTPAVAPAQPLVPDQQMTNVKLKYFRDFLCSIGTNSAKRPG